MDTLSPAQKWAPYAYSAGQKLGYDPAFILATWLYESGNGKNLGSTKYNNLAGLKNGSVISPGEYDPKDSIHAGYTSLTAFTQDFVRMVNQDNMRDFLKAARSANDPMSILDAWNASPYAVGDYDRLGFTNYYNQAAKVLGSGVTSPFDLSGLPGGNLLKSENMDGILGFLKEKWWLVAGALVLIAVIKR